MRLSALSTQEDTSIVTHEVAEIQHEDISLVINLDRRERELMGLKLLSIRTGLETTTIVGATTANVKLREV